VSVNAKSCSWVDTYRRSGGNSWASEDAIFFPTWAILECYRLSLQSSAFSRLLNKCQMVVIIVPGPGTYHRRCSHGGIPEMIRMNLHLKMLHRRMDG
jgi:hypothetical protein